jgi:hypothetical protein
MMIGADDSYECDNRCSESESVSEKVLSSEISVVSDGSYSDGNDMDPTRRPTDMDALHTIKEAPQCFTVVNTSNGVQTVTTSPNPQPYFVSNYPNISNMCGLNAVSNCIVRSGHGRKYVVPISTYNLAVDQTRKELDPNMEWSEEKVFQLIGKKNTGPCSVKVLVNMLKLHQQTYHFVLRVLYRPKIVLPPPPPP